MNNEELTAKITALEAEIVNLRGIIMSGKGPSSQKVTNRMDFRGAVTVRNDLYIQKVKDISLTAIGDTSTTNQATNITTNLNKIINALTNQ